MTPERWRQINKLFHAALAVESLQRPAFLAKACPDDEPLRNEVESLLLSHEQDADFIEAPVGDLAAAMLDEEQPGLKSGQMLGRYRIVELLAEGGMGRVYLARDATELERMAAVKVLPPEFASDPERIRRFIREARTASSLNHPNILTVYEIGEVEASRFIVAHQQPLEAARREGSRAQLLLQVQGAGG